MRKLPLIDFQHNRAMLHHIDNNFVSLFSSNVPPFLCLGMTRRNSLHCVYDLFFHNERSLIDCMSHHILSDNFCWIVSLSTLIYYYIVILLHNTFIESPHHHCFSFLPTYFILLILTSLCHFVQDFYFCCRSRYLRSKGRFFLFMLSASHFFSFACCVFSHVCRRRNSSLAPRHRFGGSPTLHLGNARTQLCLFGRSITTVLDCIHAVFIHSFWVDHSLNFNLYHSF